MSSDLFGTEESIHQGYQHEQDKIETVRKQCEPKLEIQSTKSRIKSSLLR